jgi:hypothetical protein
MSEDTSIGSAFNHLVNTGQSAVVVKASDGARIFPAQYLHLQLFGEGSKPLREAGGGVWVPQADAATILEQHLDIALLRDTADRATISFSDEARAIEFYPTNRYTCDGPSNHTYFAWELSTLKPAGPNKWECLRCPAPPTRHVT